MKSSKRMNRKGQGKVKGLLKSLITIDTSYLNPPKSKTKENQKQPTKTVTSNNAKYLQSQGVLEIPVVDIENSKYLLMKDGTYRIILNVTPINTDYFDDEDLSLVKDKIVAALAAVKSRIGIYIQKEKMNIDKNIDRMEKHKETLDDVWKDNIQAHNIANLKNSAKEINNIDRFYVVLESQSKKEATAKSELDENFRVFSKHFDDIGQSCRQLYKREILQVLYKRLNPIQSEEIEVKDDWGIEDILPQTALLHKEGDIIEIESVLLKHICFSKFRKTVDEYSWLKDALRMDDSIFIGITLNPKEGNVMSKLDKSMRKNVGSTTNKKKFSEEKATEKQISGIEEMFEQISSSNSIIYDVNITICIQALDIQDLEDKYRNLLGIINGYRYEAMRLVRKEFDPFFATLPILVSNNITKHYTYNLTIDDVASLLPFSSNEFIEEDGMVFGRNIDSRSLFILNRRNKKYHNPHLAIIADSGSGKTFAIGTFVKRELPYMDYTIIIDVVGDFKKMFPYAKSYSISPHSDMVINPFHIRSLKERMENCLNEGEEGEFSAPVTSKILDLIVFFKWIMPDMTPLHNSIFDDLLRKTYEKKEIRDNHIPDVLVFPTFDDFEEVLLNEIANPTNEDAKKQREYIYDVLKPYIRGSSSKMFNGQTNFDYEPFTVLDLSKLNKLIQPAIYDLLLNDLWNFGIKDGSNATGNPPSKSVYLDENHELARKENPQTLDFEATKLMKQGRKYNFIITTATQGLSDYLVIEKYGQAILDNSYFKFFMRLGETDYKIAKELYAFTDREMKILKGSQRNQKSTKGKGIFSVGGYKIPIQTFAYPSELKYISPNDYNELIQDGVIKDE